MFLGQLTKRIGRSLAQLALFPIRHPHGIKIVLNRMEAGELTLTDLAGLRHVVAHTPRERVAFLLQLIEQLLHALGLLGNVGTGHLADVRVGVDKAQLLQRGRIFTLHSDTGNLAQLLVAFLHQLTQRRMAAMSRHNLHRAILCAADEERIHKAKKSNVACQLVHAADLVEVAGIFMEQIDVDILDLLGALFGHSPQGLGKVAHVKLRHHCTSSWRYSCTKAR